jgi:TRAP-type mannitol/chloroaromatic compound transport system permease small subunit
MKALPAFVRSVDRLNDVIGRGVSWLTLAMVLVTFAVVVLRYGFSLGWVWLQESYVWLYALVFMLGAGYTLLHDGHVRVDIFYRPASIRFQAIVNLCGSLFLLLPMIITVAWVSIPYVVASWEQLEGSREAGGLEGLFLLKSVLLVFCLLVGLQGLAMAGRSVLILTGHPEFAPPPEEPEHMS